LSADGGQETWLNEYSDGLKTKTEQYWIAFYFIVTTVTTVGYGDIVPHRNSAKER
jgi:hypothetical protein